jgi:hypothetical protein
VGRRDPPHRHHQAYESPATSRSPRPCATAGRPGGSGGAACPSAAARLVVALSPGFREKHLGSVLRGGTLTFELRVVD